MLTRVGMDGQSDLPEVVAAQYPAGCLPGRLDRGKQQGNEQADDGDHHQQLDQGKTDATVIWVAAGHCCYLVLLSNGPHRPSIPRASG